MAACLFLKEFWVNPINVSTSIKRGSALGSLQKIYAYQKGFCVKRLKTYWFKLI
jgi:hypothetical protein